ncbi:hypothetical protein PMIN03_011485 [Paraphaeosphaeria minitans]
MLFMLPSSAEFPLLTDRGGGWKPSHLHRKGYVEIACSRCNIGSWLGVVLFELLLIYQKAESSESYHSESSSSVVSSSDRLSACALKSSWCHRSRFAFCFADVMKLSSYTARTSFLVFHLKVPG